MGVYQYAGATRKVLEYLLHKHTRKNPFFLKCGRWVHLYFPRIYRAWQGCWGGNLTVIMIYSQIRRHTQRIPLPDTKWYRTWPIHFNTKQRLKLNILYHVHVLKRLLWCGEVFIDCYLSYLDNAASSTTITY